MFHVKHFYGKEKPPAQDGNDGLYLLLGTVQRQGNIGTEQVSINGELEPAALQFHQAFGDGKPKAAALGVAAAIATDKALHQFISGNIQFIAGNIFDADGRLLFIGSRGRLCYSSGYPSPG